MNKKSNDKETKPLPKSAGSYGKSANVKETSLPKGGKPAGH